MSTGLCAMRELISAALHPLPEVVIVQSPPCPCRVRQGVVTSSRNRLPSIAWLRKRDGDNCWVCHAEINFSLVPGRGPASPTRDHVIQKRLGGTNDPANIALAHAQCNQEREPVFVTPRRYALNLRGPGRKGSVVCSVNLSLEESRQLDVLRDGELPGTYLRRVIRAHLESGS